LAILAHEQGFDDKKIMARRDGLLRNPTDQMDRMIPKKGGNPTTVLGFAIIDL